MFPSFAARLIAWQKRHGRHDLPWQKTSDPYRVWLAEIMLQQTQVAAVIPYYQRFLARFPTVSTLAEAPLEAVLALWSGLGYYARARNLWRGAREVMAHHGGALPRSPEALAKLPGIGRSTANAIAAFCFGACVPILDGNVKRVLCRYFGIADDPTKPSVTRDLWRLAEDLLPPREVGTYLQAQMDLGALICTPQAARCGECPLAEGCVALATRSVDRLPARPARSRRPVRRATLLILRLGEDFLLEARPVDGLWGGLWSFPELPQGCEATAYCRDHLGLAVDAVSPGPSFRHAFTHFSLHADTVFVTVASVAQAQGQLRRTGPESLAELPLPTPIRRLLSAIP